MVRWPGAAPDPLLCADRRRKKTPCDNCPSTPKCDLKSHTVAWPEHPLPRIRLVDLTPPPGNYVRTRPRSSAFASSSPSADDPTPGRPETYHRTSSVVGG